MEEIPNTAHWKRFRTRTTRTTSCHCGPEADSEHQVQDQTSVIIVLLYLAGWAADGRRGRASARPRNEGARSAKAPRWTARRVTVAQTVGRRLASESSPLQDPDGRSRRFPPEWQARRRPPSVAGGSGVPGLKFLGGMITRLGHPPSPISASLDASEPAAEELQGEQRPC